MHRPALYLALLLLSVQALWFHLGARRAVGQAARLRDDRVALGVLVEPIDRHHDVHADGAALGAHALRVLVAPRALFGRRHGRASAVFRVSNF